MRLQRDPNKLYIHDRVLGATLIPFIPSWVTPNMITVCRLILTPFVLVLLVWQKWDVAVPLFLFTAFTDALDGSLARLRHQVTSWGMFYDPVADKLLIGSVALLIVVKFVSWKFALVMIGIETMIAIAGFSGKARGYQMHANIFGKFKMLFQVTGITLLMISVWSHDPYLYPWAVALLVISIMLAAISLITYGL